MKKARKFACVLSIVMSGPLAAQQASPYMGLERNETKAVSEQDVNSLLAGQGMGYAKAAELNGYPGPLHVIDLADRLGLTPEQVQRTQQLLGEHRSRARALGAEVVGAERALDRLFSERRADAPSVAAAQRVGMLQARLRTEHLNTHLAQFALLDAEQVRRYGELHGYTATTQPSRDASTQDSGSHHHGKSH